MGSPSRAASFAATYAALAAAHELGDLWLQRNTDARDKGNPGSDGRKACTIHVATYVATQAAALAIVNRATGARTTWRRAALGLAISAATHYAADRRAPLKRAADLMQPIFGKADFHQLGQPRPDRDDNPSLGTGAYALDQATHHLFNTIAALIIVT